MVTGEPVRLVWDILIPPHTVAEGKMERFLITLYRRFVQKRSSPAARHGTNEPHPVILSCWSTSGFVPQSHDGFVAAMGDFSLLTLLRG